MKNAEKAISQMDILKLACERQRQIVDDLARMVDDDTKRFGAESQEAEWRRVYWRKENQRLGQLGIMLQQEYEKNMPKAFAIR